MRNHLTLAAAAGFLALGTCVAVASVPPPVIPANGTATFRFTTAVQTPQGKHSGSGTITIKHKQSRSYALTVQSDDGTTKTVALVVNSDGSVMPDPSQPAPVATDAPDAAARAFMADVALAARVGIAARKNAAAASYDVPLNLTPVGNGTPVPVTMRMTGSTSGSNKQYTGSAQGQTMTKLPPSHLNPTQLAESMGEGAVKHAVLGPVGGALAGAASLKRTAQEKEAEGGLVPDAIGLSVTTHLTDGRFHDIVGTQDDTVTVADKTVKIISTWSFTRSSP